MSWEPGFPAYQSVPAYDGGTEVHSRDLGGAPAAAAAAPAVAVTTPSAGAQAIAPQRGVATLDRPREASVISGAPRRQAPSPGKPVSSGPPLGSYRPYLIGAAVLVVVALLVGILYLPTATATVSVQGTPIKADITLLGAPGTAAGSPDHFATQAVHASQSQTFPGTPTGQNPIPAQASIGEVTFTDSCLFLYGPGTTSIPVGTTVTTSKRKRH